MIEFDKEKLREFLLFVKNKTNITSIELIEKDFYLCFLLSKLNLNEYIFKGGTCLAKVYLDYFRFSEDLDFTFLHQNLFNGKSTKSIKKICKEKIDNFGKQLELIGLDFIFDKSNKKYVELGNNNKLVTFKVWYDSIFTNTLSFVKIQINFLEKIKFKPQIKEILPLIQNNIPNEDKTYFKDYLSFYEKKKLVVYDIKEIIAEKIRSLLTRKAIKSRDSVDLLFIYQKFKIKPEEVLKETVEKTLFAMNSYEKYKDNFVLNKEKIKTTDFSYNEVKHLVIKSIKKEDFEKFIENLKPILDKIIDTLT